MMKLFEKTRKWKWFTLIAVVIAIAVVAGTISVIALAAGPDSQEEPPAPTPTVAPPPPPHGPAGQITLEDLAKRGPPTMPPESLMNEEGWPPKEQEIEIAGKKVKLPPDVEVYRPLCALGVSLSADYRQNHLSIRRGDSSIEIDKKTGKVTGGGIAAGKKGEEVFDFLITAFPEQAGAIKAPDTLNPKGISSDNPTTITIPFENSPRSVEVSR